MDNDELIKFIIDMFCKHYNYNIEEFKIKDKKLSFWGLSKINEEKNEYIVFMKDENLIDIDKSFVQNNDTIRESKFIKVLIADRSNTSEISWQLLIENLNDEVIIIDKVSNKVLYYTSKLQLLAAQMESILEYRQKLIEGRQKSRKVDIGIITTILIITNVIMYMLIAFLSGNIFDANTNVLIQLGAKENTLIAQGEYYRFITAMFLHGGIIHLGFNMYALKAIGPTIEKAFGKAKFLAIYFFGGILSIEASYIFSQDVSIGASGAIFALLGAMLILAMRMKDRIGKEMVRSILSVIAINIFIGFSLPNIDNYAHIGGLIGGVAIASILKSSDRV